MSGFLASILTMMHFAPRYDFADIERRVEEKVRELNQETEQNSTVLRNALATDNPFEALAQEIRKAHGAK